MSVGLAGAVLPALTPAAPQRWALVAVIGVVLAVVSFDWRARATLIPLAIVGHAVALARVGVGNAEVLVTVGLLVGAWALLAALEEAMHRAVEQTAADRARAEQHHASITHLAEIPGLDPQATIERIVDAIVDYGFAIANVGEVVDGYISDVATRGLPDGVSLPRIRADEGISGQAIQQGRAVYTSDYRRHPQRTPSAPVPIGSAMAMPLWNGGEVVGVLLAAKAETEEVTAEDRLFFEALGAQSSRALEVARRYRAALALAQRLTELDDLKERFLLRVTTDLRGPLTVIRGMSHVLREQAATLPEEAARELLERVDDSATRLNRMVESLLDFSRAQRSEDVARFTRVDLAAVAADVVARHAPLHPAHRLTVEAPDACPIEGDRALLGQAMAHLVDNACRHTPVGTNVVVRVQRHGNHVAVRVVDDGPGPPPQLRAAISDGAYQETVGALGITLVTHVLAAHRCSLELDDGPGTSIGFTMPVLQMGLRGVSEELATAR